MIPAPRAPRSRLQVVSFLTRSLLLPALLVPSLGLADDLAPSPEQVTERTLGFNALWDRFRERAAGLRLRAEEELISSAEYQGANTAWLRSEVSVDAGAPITDSIVLAVSPYFAWEYLTVNGDEDFVLSQQGRDLRITDFYESGLRFGTEYRFGERWGAEVVSGFSARHESGADYADAIQLGGSLAATYRRGRWLRLRLGIGIGSDLGDGNVRFSPVYRIQLKPWKDWTFETSGLGGTIEWATTRRTTVSLAGQIDSTQYRLDHRGEPPFGSGDATLQRRQGRIDLLLRHRFDDRWRFRVGVGLVLDEELSLLDEDGTDLDTQRNQDPTAIFTLGVEFRL